MDFFKSKNIKFYDFLNDNFKIKKAHSWSDISKQITIDKISATYKFFSELFPRDIDYSSYLRENKNTDTFKSLHFNILDPNTVIKEVVRYSLYSDEIFVFHPLQNPSITNSKFDPITDPLYWIQNFIDSLYFYIVLQRWIDSDIVKLIINPVDYNDKLQNKFDTEAKKRIELLNCHPDYNFNEECLYVETLTKKAILMNNELYKNLKFKLPETTLLKISAGGNLESILYTSTEINGNIYTTNNSNWFQINQLDKVDFWTKFAHLYSQVDLPFLNNVDTSFALNIRQEDRLSGVRSEFRKIYSSLNSIKTNEIDDKKIFNLNEEFKESIKNAENEWKFIKRKAQQSRVYWGMSTIGVPFLLNPVSIIAIGSALWLGNNIIGEMSELKNYRNKNSMSVYVDLKYNEPNFFSIIKNCIL